MDDLLIGWMRGTAHVELKKDESPVRMHVTLLKSFTKGRTREMYIPSLTAVGFTVPILESRETRTVSNVSYSHSRCQIQAHPFRALNSCTYA